jgi:hypothetical protein
MLVPFRSRLRWAEALRADEGLTLLGARSRGGPTLAATTSAMACGMGAPGAIAGSETPARSGFVGDALVSALPDDAAVRTAANSADARIATSTRPVGAMDATDMCMNSRYPPTVTTEAPATAMIRGELVKPGGGGARGSRLLLQPREIQQMVIDGPLLNVAKDFVGADDLPELQRGVGIAGMAVGMSTLDGLTEGGPEIFSIVLRKSPKQIVKRCHPPAPLPDFLVSVRNSRREFAVEDSCN